MIKMLSRVAAALLAASTPLPAFAETILFVGNSFTYAGNTAARTYRTDTVNDLNHEGVGGMPAIFKQFALQSGLNFDVSLETGGGRTLSWHWAEKRTLLDRPWDRVVLQEYSTLNPDKPGDATNLVDMVGRFAALFGARNPRTNITLIATWSRPDQTFVPGGNWFGRSIFDMSRELYAAYQSAAKASRVAGIAPAGLAFNCAIQEGVADPNPYDGITFGQIDLWTYDHYHASVAGTYLEALTVFGRVTGRDPRLLGEDERAARELGLSKKQASALQRVAWKTLAEGCGA